MIIAFGFWVFMRVQKQWACEVRELLASSGMNPEGNAARADGTGATSSSAPGRQEKPLASASADRLKGLFEQERKPPTLSWLTRDALAVEVRNFPGAVALHRAGAVRFEGMQDGTWHFSVKSGSHLNLAYDVSV